MYSATLLINRKINLYFIEKLIMCCFHGNQCIVNLKCKYLLLMTYIASVTWLWRNSDYDNSFLSFSNDSVYVHILMHFDKCILKRFKYNSNITVIWRHHYVIINLVGVWTATKNYHTFVGSMKSLNYVSFVNILLRQNIENNFKNTVWWHHSDVITFKCNTLQSKDRTCHNYQLPKVSSNSD